MLAIGSMVLRDIVTIGLVIGQVALYDIIVNG